MRNKGFALVFLFLGVTIVLILAFRIVFNINQPAEKLPKLSVKGNALVAESGGIIILRGAAIEDPALASRGVFFGAREEDMEEFAKWNFNLIRVPIHPEQYQKDKEYLKRYVDPIVRNARKKGIYVLVGWHAHGNPLTGEVESTDWGNNPYNPDLGLAKVFWMETSQRYSGNPSVLYSIFNEPAYITWDKWKGVAEELISIVRGYDPEKIIFISGINWGADLKAVGQNPIRAKNISYEVHPYPAVYPEGSKDWDLYFGYLTGQYHVFVGEWGYQPNGKIKELDVTTKDYGQPLMEYIKKKGMSWSAWVWSDVWTPPMLKNWNYQPTDFGTLIKEELKD